MNGTEGVQAQASDESEDDEEGLYRLDAEPTDAGSGGGRSEDDEDEEEEEGAEEDKPTSAPEPIVLLSDARVSHITAIPHAPFARTSKGNALAHHG